MNEDLSCVRLNGRSFSDHEAWHRMSAETRKLCALARVLLPLPALKELLVEVHKSDCTYRTKRACGEMQHVLDGCIDDGGVNVNGLRCALLDKADVRRVAKLWATLRTRLVFEPLF